MKIVKFDDKENEIIYMVRMQRKPSEFLDRESMESSINWISEQSKLGLSNEILTLLAIDYKCKKPGKSRVFYTSLSFYFSESFFKKSSMLFRIAPSLARRSLFIPATASPTVAVCVESIFSSKMTVPVVSSLTL